MDKRVPRVYKSFTLISSLDVTKKVDQSVVDRLNNDLDVNRTVISAEVNEVLAYSFEDFVANLKPGDCFDAKLFDYEVIKVRDWEVEVKLFTKGREKFLGVNKRSMRGFFEAVESGRFKKVEF